MFALQGNGRATNETTADASRCVCFALRVAQSPTFRQLLLKLAGLAAFHQHEIHGTTALVRVERSLLRPASELRQQRLDPRYVIAADAQVEVVVYTGLLAHKRIDAPATINPIVDPTGVKGFQDFDYVLTRHLGHNDGQFPRCVQTHSA